MSELKVTSKKYNDRDVLEVDNLGESVNEEIEAGKIPASGTKLYQHYIKVGGEEIEIISTKETPYTYNQLNDLFMGKGGVLTIRDITNNLVLVNRLSVFTEGNLVLTYVDSSIPRADYTNTGFSDTVTPL